MKALKAVVAFIVLLTLPVWLALSGALAGLALQYKAIALLFWLRRK